MRLKFLVSISILFSTVCVSQTITGIVLEAKTNAPIESASVYFDNTTIGTSTDANGRFEIDNYNQSSSPLIISFLGYAKVILSDCSSDVFYKILLEESPNTLDEVLITSFDGMSRELKLKYFRTQFLGFSEAAQSCSILNEEDVILRYDKKEQRLTANSKYPIQIKNEDLQYLVTFDIQEFSIDFAYVNLEAQKFRMKSMIYTGTTFYKPLENTITKKTEKNRRKAYKGSVLHFMRALSNQTLKADNFSIVSAGFVVKPENYISVSKLDSTASFEVKLRAPLSVLYENELQTDIKVSSPKVEDPKPYYNVNFDIDAYGNYSPIGAFYLIGYMGNLRVGDSLPSDYNLLEGK